MRTISFRELDRLPNQPGIYHAIDKYNRIRYVGQATNLRKRWSRHEKHALLIAIGCVKLRYRTVQRHWLNFEEAIDIERFDPDVNTQHPNPEKQWNWLMRIDCWLGNIGAVGLSFAIALLIMQFSGSTMPKVLVDRLIDLVQESDRCTSCLQRKSTR